MTGNTTLTAVPDEFVFYPTFSLKGQDEAQLKEDLNETVTEVIATLKALGVEESKIKLTAYSSGEQYLVAIDRTGSRTNTSVTASLTIILDSQELAQQVQDYLQISKAEGQLTPFAQFSEAKRQELESQARAGAIEDARAKANQSAELLGLRLGRAITVSDLSGFDFYPLAEGRGAQTTEDSVTSDSSSLPVLPGENEFNLSISVVFSLK